jgi:hypothetical protein
MTTTATTARNDSCIREFCKEMPAAHSVSWLVTYAANWKAAGRFHSVKASKISQQIILEEALERVRKLGCELTADEVEDLFWYICIQTEDAPYGRYGQVRRWEEKVDESESWRWSEEGDGSWKEMFQIDLTDLRALPLLKIIAALPYHGITVAALVEHETDNDIYPDDSRHYKTSAQTLESLERMGWVEQKKRKFSVRFSWPEGGVSEHVSGVVLKLRKNR